jgi:hypothetical protein
MIAFTYQSLDFSAFVLYPEDGDPTIALGLGIEF